MLSLGDLLRRNRRSAGAEAEAATTQSVFFGRFWIGGAVAVLLVGMATGRRAPTLLALLVLVAAGLTYAWSRAAFRGLSFARAASTLRAFPGDEVTVTLSAVNRKPLPLPWLTIDEEVADGLEVLDREATSGGSSGRQLVRITTTLGPFERGRWRLRLRCPRRGVFGLGPATLRSGDAFGFFSTRLHLPAEDGPTILVYPRVHPLPDLGFPSRRPLGETRVARHLLTDPARPIGVRDYHAEDPFRAIHWKASARLGRLQVRVEEPAGEVQLGIFVNLDTFDHYWEGLDLDLAERAIEVAASLAVWAEERRYAVGVYANGLLAGSDQPLRVPPGRGPAQVPLALSGLAKVNPYATHNVARVLRREAARFPWGSTFAIVTSRLPEPLVALLTELIAAGHRVVRVAVSDVPVPALRGLIVRRVSGTRWRATPSDCADGGVARAAPPADRNEVADDNMIVVGA